jgi:hypothetical protein
MPIPQYPANTIILTGFDLEDMESVYPAGVTGIYPGMQVELYNKSGVMSVRPQSSATAQARKAIAIEADFLNRTVTDPYLLGEQVTFWYPEMGDHFMVVIPSGQNIIGGDYLQANGDGRFTAATATTADANVAWVQALDSSGAVTADTLLRVSRVA